MGFLGGIGKVFSKAFDAVKSFAKSGLGQTLIGIAGTAIGGPIGGTIAKAATGLLSGGGLKFQNLARAGLSLFGGVADKFGLGPLVQNLGAATKPTTGLGGFNLGSLTQIAGRLLSGTKFGQGLSNIVSKAQQFLGTATNIGNQATGFLGKVSDILGKFGINTQIATDISNRINSVLNGANRISGILQQVSDILNAGAGGNMSMLRA